MAHKLPKSLIVILSLIAATSLLASMYLELYELEFLQQHPISVNLMSGVVGFSTGIVVIAVGFNWFISREERSKRFRVWDKALRQFTASALGLTRVLERLALEAGYPYGRHLNLVPDQPPMEDELLELRRFGLPRVEEMLKASDCPRFHAALDANDSAIRVQFSLASKGAKDAIKVAQAVGYHSHGHAERVVGNLETAVEDLNRIQALGSLAGLNALRAALRALQGAADGLPTLASTHDTPMP